MTMKALRKNGIAMSSRQASQTGNRHEDLEFWQLLSFFQYKLQELASYLNKTHINVQVIE